VPQLWQGVGFSFIFVALSTAALATMAKADMTAASGLYNVVRQVCGSVGIAAAASELTRGVTRFHGLLAEHVTLYDLTTRHWLLGATAAMRRAGSDPYTAGRQAIGLLDLDVTRQATVLSYNHVFLLIAALFVLVVPLVLLLRGARLDAEVALAAE
jgi:DHA2 family multidrug resistance protein